MKKLIAFILLTGISFSIKCFSITLVSGSEVRVTSPNGLHEFLFYQKQDKNLETKLYYNIGYKGQPLILESGMGLELDNRTWERALARNIKRGSKWYSDLVFQRVERTAKDTVWSNPYGERSLVRDHYSGAVITLVKPDDSNYKMVIEVRAYNEGVAFRYTFPEHPQAIYHKVLADDTEYTLPEGTKAWCAEWAQAPYQELTIPEWKSGQDYERALTLCLPKGYWVALTDADTKDWCLTRFRKAENKQHTIVSSMYSAVDMVTPFITPWKVIMAADSPGQLLEQNDLILNLNPSCKIEDTTWIKPGKIMRETTLTTENALACIDFCAAHKMQYILFDWKWYGPATTFSSDATKVVAPIDMPRVVQYGKEKGIGVWVYVNQHALQKQAGELFPLFSKWGLAGVKFGFVQYATHRWSVWVHDLVKLAAENQLMVNIHDEYRPSGFSRTYPNLLTQEGIRGNEEFPDATHNTVLPFTRMLSGAGDYTICYYDKRLKTTHAHQLAASLIFFSPLQTLYWYDKPSYYEGEPEITFFDHLPVVFDDTKVVSGKPGESVVIARRSGNEWFLGGITNNNTRQLTISTDFLDKGEKYIVRVYEDDDKVKTKTKVKVSERKIKTGETLKFNLIASGGIALHFIPSK